MRQALKRIILHSYLVIINKGIKTRLKEKVLLSKPILTWITICEWISSESILT